MEKVKRLTKLGHFVLLTLIFSSVVGAVTFNTHYNPWTYTLDYYRTGNFSGENITVDNLYGNLSWSYLNNYPVACPDGTYITQLNDNVTCTRAVKVTGDTMTGDLTIIADLNVESVSANYDVNASNFYKTSGTPGSVLFLDDNGKISENNSVFYWDYNNGFLGIGKDSPSEKLDVVGNIYINGSLNVTGNITAEYLIAVKDIIVLNDSSVFIGGFQDEDPARINVTTYISPTDNSTRRSVVINKDLFMIHNYNKSSILAVENSNDTVSANARIFSVNNADIATAIGKENYYFSGFGGSSMGSFYNQFGNMYIMNGPTQNSLPFLPNATEMHIGFYGNLERGGELSNGEFYNVSDLILLTTKNVTIYNDTYINANLKITKNLNVTSNISSDYNDYKGKIAKFYKIESQSAASTDTWYNVTWNLMNENETTDGWYTLSDINNSITINNIDGIFRIEGCIHPYNDDAGTQESTLYTRILVNNIEQRCLQASVTKSFKGNGVDILHFTGTVNAYSGDKINLQFRVTNTNIILNGSNVFDNPVSASINIEKISNLK